MNKPSKSIPSFNLRVNLRECTKSHRFFYYTPEPLEVYLFAMLH